VKARRAVRARLVTARETRAGKELEKLIEDACRICHRGWAPNPEVKFGDLTVMDTGALNPFVVRLTWTRLILDSEFCLLLRGTHVQTNRTVPAPDVSRSSCPPGPRPRPPRRPTTRCSGNGRRVKVPPFQEIKPSISCRLSRRRSPEPQGNRRDRKQRPAGHLRQHDRGAREFGRAMLSKCRGVFGALTGAETNPQLQAVNAR